MSKAEYSRYRIAQGLFGNYATVCKNVREGKISCIAEQWIDPKVADAEWIKNIDVAHIPISSPQRVRQCSQAQGLSDDEIPDYLVSKARIESIKAIKEQLSLDELQGQLVRVSAVHEEIYSIFISLRGAILNIPSRYAPELASLTDVSDIERLLDAAIREELESASAMIARSKTLKQS